MKFFATSLTGVLLLGALAAPALAGHDENPSPRVTTYTYDLSEVADNHGGDLIDGTARLKALPNGKVQVKVEAEGLAPHEPHAQHLHAIEDEDDKNEFVQGECPGTKADENGDDLVDTVEGIPGYGGVVQSLTTTGDTSGDSALAVDRFPVADADGVLEYERTFTPTDERVWDQLGEVEVVVHGIDLNGDGEYDFTAGDSSLNPGVPLEATIPALCGGPTA